METHENRICWVVVPQAGATTSLGVRRCGGGVGGGGTSLERRRGPGRAPVGTTNHH